MGLQSAVNVKAAAATPGDKATVGQSVYAPVTRLAGEGGVTAGSFAWQDEAGALVSHGENAPRGLVERSVTTAGLGTGLTVPRGGAVTLAVKGDYWVTSAEAAQEGGQVYAVKTDGSVTASDGGGSAVAAEGWRFRTSGEAGDTVIISNWS